MNHVDKTWANESNDKISCFPINLWYESHENKHLPLVLAARYFIDKMLMLTFLSSQIETVSLEIFHV